MRALFPREGDPWPDDMVISITDDSQPLTELLWLREAWGLHPVGDVPPLLVDAPAPVGRSPRHEEWEAIWPDVWASSLPTSHGTLSPEEIAELERTIPGSPEAAEVLSRITGPESRKRFGHDAFPEEFREWSHERFERNRGVPYRSLEETPERRSLDALVPAWRSGLRNIITIPCHGTYTRIVSDSKILMTAETRHDPAMYSAALREFAAR